VQLPTVGGFYTPVPTGIGIHPNFAAQGIGKIMQNQMFARQSALKRAASGVNVIQNALADRLSGVSL
jgi:hypothetical protein